MSCTVSQRVSEKPVCRGMGILPMGRRTILALLIRRLSRGETPVGLTGRMPVPLFKHPLRKPQLDFGRSVQIYHQQALLRPEIDPCLVVNGLVAQHRRNWPNRDARRFLLHTRE